MPLFESIDYIDGITIINHEGTILFTIKFNPNIDKQMEETIVGKKLFDVFYNLDSNSSSLFECMKTEKIIERRGQLVKNHYTEDSLTDNISFPIRHGGLVVGAIELSKVISNNKQSFIELKREPNNIKGTMQMRPKCLNLGFTATYFLENIITQNKQMLELIDLAKSVAESTAPIFITGETGTGKELFAQGVHNASDRRNKPFIAQNCSAIPENLIESTFFGTSKGSYTGAIDRKGLFEACDGGTLFLDELHCMPIHLQAKLLRAIESRTVRRIGENEEKKFDVRIIAATNINSDTILSQGHIRHDLYYRLAVVKINIPPLRERLDDLIILSDFFINKYNRIFGKNVKSISHALLAYMTTYTWPGNVREFENFLESAILYCSKDKSILEMKGVSKLINQENMHHTTKPLKSILDDIELKYIKEAIMISKGNVSKAAEYLELPRQTLQQKMMKYNIAK